ncbi:MAG: sterol desaturase family protein [Betaproteobacteria bacterium]|nr:sterol desaturase family protein [Betaproteobacteria bacterium]
MRRRDLWTHGTVIAMIALLAVLLLGAWRVGSLTGAWPLLLLPVALAPFVELGLHRFVLHARLPARDGLRRRLQVDLHHAHHADPRCVRRLFWPAWALLPLGVGTYAGYALVFGPRIALVPMAGSVAYFVFYEWMHFSHHDPGYLPRTRYGARMRRAHMLHHYYNSDRWWGITNDLADVLFGTAGDKAATAPARERARKLL